MTGSPDLDRFGGFGNRRRWTRAPRVAIVGSGDHGVVALHILRSAGREVIGFIDEDPTRHDTLVAGLPVLGDLGWFRGASDVAAFVAIGANTSRRALGTALREAGVETISAVHPSAIVMEAVSLGAGSFVGPGAVIVTGSIIGDDVIINTGATVDHDCFLGDAAHLAPGTHTGGHVRVGVESLIGIGTSIAAGIEVGSRSVVGMGSVVLADVPPHVVAAGVPARIIRPLRSPIDWEHLLRPSSSRRETIREGR